MARIIGNVKAIEAGKFFVKDDKGNAHQLKVGDSIHEGEHVYGALLNAKDANIVIDVMLAGAGDLVISGNGALQFDASLLEGVFSHHDSVVYVNSVKDALAMAAAAETEKQAVAEDQIQKGDVPAAGDETAAGDVVTDTERMADTFASRTGAITDVTTDLRSTEASRTGITVETNEVTLLPTGAPSVSVALLPTVDVQTFVVDPEQTALNGDSENATEVNVVITDAEGNEVASYTNVPVGTDGTWSIDISGEEFDEETEYTATATASDNANNVSAPDSMTDGYDLLPTVDVQTFVVDPEQTALSGDSENATEVNVVITDAQGNEVASYDNVEVDENGNWSVDISGEEFDEETEYTATATASDNANNVSAPDSMTDGYEDTVPLAEGAQNTVIANAEGMAAEASLGINWGADGYKEGSITTPLVEEDTNYVMGIASNGDTFVVTSGTSNLVYMTLEDGTIAAVKEGTEETVFTVAVNEEGTGYVTTMVGTVDPYIYTDTLVETNDAIDGSVVGSRTDSVTFTLPEGGGGGNVNQLVLASTDPSTGITLTLTATGDAPGTDHDTVNYSTQRIGVNGGDTIDTGETLTLQITSDTAGVKITGIDVVTDSLDGPKETGNKPTPAEIAQADLFNGTTPIGTDTISGEGQGANSDEDWSISDGTPVTGESFDTVKFTVNTGDGYGILINQGITANYTYEVNVPTTTTTETTTVTETAYDFTIPMTFSGIDGDDDDVTTDFHITFDANNDGVLTSIDSGETSATVSVIESTVTTTELVNDSDAAYLPPEHPLQDTIEVVTTDPTVVDEYSVDVDTALVQETLEDFGTYTDSDVLAVSVGDSVLIDGGAAGIDTLVLSEDEEIDFSTLGDNNPVSNIEVIDLTQSGDHDMTISLDNVVVMTDENNDLTILRDSTDDSVTTDVTTLENTGEVTIGSDTFDTYANVENTDPTVTLKIEQVDDAPIA